jgi:beta-lactamase class A
MTDFDLADGDGVRWSALAVDIDSGETLFSSHPERVLDTASIGKLFLLHTVLDQADHGRLDLTERVKRLPFEMIDDSGLW